MITVQEAKRIIDNQIFLLTTTTISVTDAVDHILAEDIYATVDIPSFRQSSKDGYAIAYGSLQNTGTFPVVKEVPAGKQDLVQINSGETARIFTGSPLPHGADTVVMQEYVTVSGGSITIEQPNLKPGENVRAAGSEIKAGALALPHGTMVSPAAIGFLSAIGITKVTVYCTPSVAVIVTGDELQSPGEVLGHGQVYEASSGMLEAAMKQMGIEGITRFEANDNLSDTVEKLEAALTYSDVILLTGGVSVGDYDFVLPAAAECGVEQLFHKVNQRPGKPLYFGRKGEKPVFGLPGNPSSVLTCFYQYVWPLLRKMSGKSSCLGSVRVPLAHGYNKTHNLTHFLKGTFANGQVTILNAQDSFQLSSFALANCLVELGEEMHNYSSGETVTIYMLPCYG